MFGNMKLNGKFYLRGSTIINQIEDLIMLLESESYTSISENIRNISVDSAEIVALKLAKLQDVFIVYFKNETHCKCDFVVDVLEKHMYNPTTDSVKLYTHGADGVLVKADEESDNKYIFNICLQKLKSILTKIK